MNILIYYALNFFFTYCWCWIIHVIFLEHFLCYPWQFVFMVGVALMRSTGHIVNCHVQTKLTSADPKKPERLAYLGRIWTTSQWLHYFFSADPQLPWIAFPAQPEPISAWEHSLPSPNIPGTLLSLLSSSTPRPIPFSGPTRRVSPHTCLMTPTNPRNIHNPLFLRTLHQLPTHPLKLIQQQFFTPEHSTPNAAGLVVPITTSNTNAHRPGDSTTLMTLNSYMPIITPTITHAPVPYNIIHLNLMVPTFTLQDAPPFRVINTSTQELHFSVIHAPIYTTALIKQDCLVGMFLNISNASTFCTTQLHKVDLSHPIATFLSFHTYAITAVFNVEFTIQCLSNASRLLMRPPLGVLHIPPQYEAICPFFRFPKNVALASTTTPPPVTLHIPRFGHIWTPVSNVLHLQEFPDVPNHFPQITSVSHSVASLQNEILRYHVQEINNHSFPWKYILGIVLVIFVAVAYFSYSSDITEKFENV